jgi:hypothetical protein
MKAAMALVLVAMVMAGCAAEETAETDLRLTCQLNKCICASPPRAFLAPEPDKPVLWKDNGDAYCPEGYQLKLAKE